MEQADLERITGQFDQVVRERFADAPVQRVAVLQYGDDPEVEPGELLARVYIEASGDQEQRRLALESFHSAHREAIHELRNDLDRIREAGPLEFVLSDEGDEKREFRGGPRIRLGRRLGALEGSDAERLIPVMARLGPADLETVDTLIQAGIAANRAEAVRWALARVRERPAYTQLQEKAREIGELKTQF
jgi:hypothetical protein